MNKQDELLSMALMVATLGYGDDRDGRVADTDGTLRPDEDINTTSKKSGSNVFQEPRNPTRNSGTRPGTRPGLI